MNSKHISELLGTGGNSLPAESANTDNHSEYLKELKILVDEKVKALPDQSKLEHGYIRDRLCLAARRTLGLSGFPTKAELDSCFPDHDNSDYVKRAEKLKSDRESGKTLDAGSSEPMHQPTQEEAKERLDNPSDPKPETDEIQLSKEDWEWIEKANSPFGGRLFFGCAVTPEFMELDLKHGISNSPHRRRLLDYLSLHCTRSTGITTEFTINFLAEKLQCRQNKVRGAIRWLVEKGILEFSEGSGYPKHFEIPIVFKIPHVASASQTMFHTSEIKKEIGLTYKELWKARELLDFPVKCGGEAETE